MNRSQRRKLEREQGKEVAQYNAQAKWLDTLLPWQKKVIDTMLREAKVDAEIDSVAVVDKILIGVLLEHDFTWEEAYNFNTMFGRYYAEYKFEVAKIGKEKRLKMLIELESEIVEKIENGIQLEKTRGQIVKEIKQEYKGVGITTPEINNVYGRTLESYKSYIKEFEPAIIKKVGDCLNKNEKTESIIKLLKVEYPKISEKDLRGLFILGKDEFMKPKYKDYTDVPYSGAESDKRAAEKRKTKKEVSKKEKAPEEKVKEAIVEVGKAGAEFLKEFNKVVKEKKMSNLKIINEVVKVVSRELEGEFGKYIVDENGVTREDITFKDLAAVEIYKKEQLEKFEREIAELQAVFAFREN